MNLKNIAKSKNTLIIVNFILFLGLIVSIHTILSINKKIAVAKEAARPADLSIITLKEPSCQDCSDLTPVINAIKKENVKINSEKIINASDPAGIKLISRYNIKKAPTLIISGEIKKNAKLNKMWEQLGEIKDNTFILTQVGAPYVLTSSGEVKGKIKLIMLADNSCAKCYDVAKHEQILKRFGLPIKNSQTINSQSADGKKLIAEYKIKLLPTIILTGDVASYPILTKIWPKIGTIEKNGAYVFREGVKHMGIYKDLTVNKVISPAASPKAKKTIK